MADVLFHFLHASLAWWGLWAVMGRAEEEDMERGSPLPYLVGPGEGLQAIQLLGILPWTQNTVAQNTVQRGEARRIIDEAPFRDSFWPPRAGWGSKARCVLSSQALVWEHKCRKVLRRLS